MSDKIQHTAASMREKMVGRYGDVLHHKHNKNHIPYRLHYRTHPCNPTNPEEEIGSNGPTGLIREFKLRKIRKRLDKGEYH